MAHVAPYCLGEKYLNRLIKSITHSQSDDNLIIFTYRDISSIIAFVKNALVHLVICQDTCPPGTLYGSKDDWTGYGKKPH
jgi:hypothetical protein